MKALLDEYLPDAECTPKTEQRLARKMVQERLAQGAAVVHGA